MGPWGKRESPSSSSMKSSRKSKGSKLPNQSHHHQNGNSHAVTASRDSNNSSVDETLYEAPINRLLPRELILKVLSYLDLISLCRCSTVCKYWNVLAHDGSIWMDVDLFEFQRDVQSVVVENIARRCGPFLRRLNLHGCQHLSDEALKSFAFFCKNIEVLTLQECRKVTDECCRALARHCPKLRKLNMDSCNLITNDGIKALSEGCQSLTDINISWCEQVGEESVKQLVTSCVKLKSFVAKGCVNLKDDAIRALADNCPDLKVLNLKNCTDVSDISIQLIGKQCPDLEFLSLSNCTRISNESLIALAHGCPKLTTLELAGCSQLSDMGFITLCQACPELQCLDLEECIHITDATLVNIASYCPKIERLCLSHCESIGDVGIQSLIHGTAARTSQLKVLELDNCPLLTDNAIETLQECQSLQRVDLFDCQQISRGAVRRLTLNLRNAKVHAYFAPGTPPPAARRSRQRICRCCSIL